MIATIAEIAQFLLDHADLISLLKDALVAGVDKGELMETIKQSMITASDATMEVELGLPTRKP